MTHAVIVDAVRTATGKGKPGGALSGVHPVDLFATTLRALADRTGLDPATLDDVVGGCVTQTGEQTFNVTRNAVLAAGFPESVPGVTIDRQCGSSLQALQFAAALVISGVQDVVIAGGVESMSRAPMFSSLVGKDPRGPMVNARYPEGLVDQGISAELIAARWGFTREQLDEFAAASHEKAAAAQKEGLFADEIVPVGGHATDELVRPGTTVEKLAGLNAAFRSDELAARFPEIGWCITAGNSSPLTDGASAALVMSQERAAQLGLTPRARILATAAVGSDPLLMLTGVIPATEKVLAKAGLTIDQIDAYEVNEAFAPVPMAWARDVHADPERLNIRGGAIAIGHPLGGTGTKLVSTLLRVLEGTGGRTGLVAICEGGGMANAMVIERL
ncbi:MAG TPA: thiolase family protein [Kineosporiaceae bacterium]|nr:thiolase family protein [Kineosporiaceae bacterium]